MLDAYIEESIRLLYKTGEINHPPGWSEDDVVDYMMRKADILGDYEKVGLKGAMERERETFPQWAKSLIKKIDRFMSALGKYQASIIKRGRSIKKKQRFPGFSNSLFGLGTRDLISKSDLTLGLHQKNLNLLKDEVKRRVVRVLAQAKKKGLYPEFEKAMRMTIEMSKSQGEAGVWKALETFAEVSEKKLSIIHSVKDYSKPGSMPKRASPTWNNKPPKRPTVDDEDEEETSPFAEEEKAEQGSFREVIEEAIKHPEEVSEEE